MAKAPVPKEKPRLSSSALRTRIAPFGIDRSSFPLVVVGIRGYYKNSMGAPGVNDRGIYDDALFIDTSQVTAAFNGNTDPSCIRKGHGRGSAKGMASLNPGAWFAHRFGLHKGKYLALCQTGGDVTVTRDGDPDYQDTGRFGINIHRGSFSGTSSLGCQTVHPAQWESFIALARDQAMRFFPGDAWKRRIVPYVLLQD
jgi:lysozyme